MCVYIKMNKNLKVKNIVLEKDLRESNLIKNNKEEIIGYRQSEFICKIYFENGECAFVPSNPEIFNILQLISKNEDYKYPNGLGRNMILLAYIYPLYKTYFKKYGFVPLKSDLNFAQQQARNKDLNYDKFLKEIEDENNKN